MKKNILNDSEFKTKIVEIYREEQIKIIKERWESLTGSEKRFVFEFVKTYTPEKSYLLNESRWWNTIGDIVGIFDPTGVVDLINGMDYIRQGDTLFGIMSLVSAIPYLGDLVGKPVVLAMKAGGDTARLLRGIKTVRGAASAGGKIPIFGRLLSKMGEIGPKLLEIVKKVPGGKGLVKTIEGWVELLTKASKEYKAGGKLVRTGGKLTSSEFRAFRNYGINPEWGWLKRVWKKGGFFGKNRQLSRLFGKTKFWLGFLDFAGIGNFVGPDELSQQMGQTNLDSKMEQYMNTPQAQQNWTSEMGNIPSEGMTPPPPPPQQQQQQTGDFDIMKMLFGI
jgi:hypothetical protein